jgi:hypothetical protein
LSKSPRAGEGKYSLLPTVGIQWWVLRRKVYISGTCKEDLGDLLELGEMRITNIVANIVQSGPGNELIKQSTI